MKIKMLETVEDSHLYMQVDEAGKAKASYDVRKFYNGLEYDDSAAYPDWVRRAEGFVAAGLAVEVAA